MEQAKKINGKALYTTKGAAMEYGRIGCNFYTGCPHNCTYCYLKRGAPSKQLGSTEVRLKKCFKDEEAARQTFIREMFNHHEYLRKVGIFFSFTTDPMIPETRELTRFAVSMANMHGVPVKILTKNADFTDIYGKIMQMLLSSTFFPKDIEFGFTLTGRDDMEPGASSNHDRIEAMRYLHRLGFKTFASIEPVIDWQHARMVIDLSLDCCDHYKIGLRSGVKKDYYNLVTSGMNIRDLTEQIVKAGRTVYLKESTRKMLLRCFADTEYNRIMGYALDMDGNPYHTPVLSQQQKEDIKKGWFANTDNIREIDKPSDARFSVGQIIVFEDRFYEIIGYYDYYDKKPQFLAVSCFDGFPVGLPFVAMEKMRPIELDEQTKEE